MLSGNTVSAPGEGTRLDSDSELLLVKFSRDTFAFLCTYVQSNVVLQSRLLSTLDKGNKSAQIFLSPDTQERPGG